MREKPTPKPVYLKDYRPPAFWIPECRLAFDLDPGRTIVESTLKLRPNPLARFADTQAARPASEGLRLHAEQLEILSVSIDGKKLSESEYEFNQKELWIPSVPKGDFSVEIVNAIAPERNTALEGLYVSGKILCTQNEAEGFRRITPFLDRPDVMTRFEVSLTADPEAYPVLLSNGNRISEETLSDGKKRVHWKDPFPKPCYLFALVAGRLGSIHDSFLTKSGRRVRLEIYVDPGNEDRARFAMQSLKEAMRWDEDRFGLEYDLDLYMIVAVEDFNMGAMENKGLNLFNAKLVLASPKTATDDLFEAIEGVIAHEYFHNWTGNRVTCRDWFSLTLKEGLTVYRDQRFTEDRTSRAVKRIKDVIHLRSLQFAEDAGPLAHPIQPDQYIEINNFYTLTVYEKGAEVVRMIATLIGEDAFARGITEYFRLYDGQAVTIDEFLNAMGRVSDLDVAFFRRWYKTAGTPVLHIKEEFDTNTNTFILHISQEIPERPHSLKTEELLIPLRMGLLDSKGRPLRLKASEIQLKSGKCKIRELSENEICLDLFSKNIELGFLGVSERPVVSLLRNFSAPVKLSWNEKRDAKDLGLLFAHDPDPFARFDAGQSLMHGLISGLVVWIEDNASETELADGESLLRVLRDHPVSKQLLSAFRNFLDLDFASSDLLYTALALRLPGLSEVTDRQNPPAFEESHAVLTALRAYLATELHQEWKQVFDECKARLEDSFGDSMEGPVGESFDDSMRNETAENHLHKIYNKKDAGLRRLKNMALRYLCSEGIVLLRGGASRGSDAWAMQLCYEEFCHASNLTEELAAFQILCDTENPYREAAIRAFREKWQHDSLVMDYYFSVQASSPLSGTIEAVENLRNDPYFRMENPNKVRSLYGAFGKNVLCFHQANGKGYELLARAIVELNSINAAMAAGLARAFTKTPRLDEKRKALACRALERILEAPNLTDEVYEIARSCLGAD